VLVTLIIGPAILVVGVPPMLAAGVVGPGILAAGPFAMLAAVIINPALLTVAVQPMVGVRARRLHVLVGGVMETV